MSIPISEGTQIIDTVRIESFDNVYFNCRRQSRPTSPEATSNLKLAVLDNRYSLNKDIFGILISRNQINWLNDAFETLLKIIYLIPIAVNESNFYFTSQFAVPKPLSSGSGSELKS